jgi:formylglycine-generating enzyme required for sulfatase activity
LGKAVKTAINSCFWANKRPFLGNPVCNMHNQTLEYLNCTVRDVTFRLVNIPAGRFSIKSRKYGDKKPIYKVQVQAFWLAEYPCTQSLYQAVTGHNPSYFQGQYRPVEQVSWEEVNNDFLPHLKHITQLPFRLPSEAEWEYAARAGGNFTYAGGDNLHHVGWYEGNSHQETKPVGLKMPNAWGLYDMSGNVWEWCEDDWHHDHNCNRNVPSDGLARVGEPTGTHRVVRGGGWTPQAYDCRVTDYHSYGSWVHNKNLGFRFSLTQRVSEPFQFFSVLRKKLQRIKVNKIYNQ